MPATIEADILSRIIDTAYQSLPATAAEALLRLGYSEADHSRMAELAQKSNEGLMTQDEQRELEAYVIVGDFLSTIKSKARLSLKNHSSVA